MRRLLAGALVMLSVPGTTWAQDGAATAGIYPEVRIDAIFAERRSSLQAGGGVQVPVGYYVRVGVIGAVGTSIGSEGGVDGRIDLLGRFLFDPFRQSKLGFSAGAGLGVRTARGEGIRPVMIAALDIEGTRGARGISPALQVGLGGGVRVGVAFRWGSPRAESGR